MKIQFLQKRKLKAATARRMTRTGMEDYAQEPNMSFARAIVVVVILHLVAVAGICVFSSLKVRNIGTQNPPPHPANPTTAGIGGTGNGGDTLKTAGQPGAQEGQAPAGPVVTYVKPATGANPAAQTANPDARDAASPVKDAAAFYTVARGDTPVSIAKKLHVGYDDLLKLNKITDPKKLQVGQKLRIPAKKKPAAKPPTSSPA